MAKIKAQGVLNLLMLLPSLVTTGAALFHTIKSTLKNKPPTTGA